MASLKKIDDFQKEFTRLLTIGRELSGQSLTGEKPDPPKLSEKEEELLIELRKQMESSKKFYLFDEKHTE